jgi:hypothetical protein
VVIEKKMRWAAHMACIRITEIHTDFWWRNLKEIDKLEKLVVDEVTILKLTLKEIEYVVVD